MITRSIRMLKKNMGIVIRVGIAARFAIRVIAIDAIAKGQRTKLFPVNVISKHVIGVIRQPWAMIIAASHNKRFSSCALHQARNL
ncbi:MAG: hypothetical protein ACHQEM_12030 [Chitinophagales bacterium]